MNNISRINFNKRRSSVVVYNDIVFVGGQTAEDRSQDVRGQSQQTLANIDKSIAEAGTDNSRLLTAQIWLKDIKDDFAGMNEVWDAWTAPDAAPTHATGQCEMGHPEVLVEIISTAAVGKAEVQMKINDIDPKWPVAGIDGVIINGRLTWQAGRPTGRAPSTCSRASPL